MHYLLLSERDTTADTPRDVEEDGALLLFGPSVPHHAESPGPLDAAPACLVAVAQLCPHRAGAMQSLELLDRRAARAADEPIPPRRTDDPHETVATEQPVPSTALACRGLCHELECTKGATINPRPGLDELLPAASARVAQLAHDLPVELHLCAQDTTGGGLEIHHPMPDAQASDAGVDNRMEAAAALLPASRIRARGDPDLSEYAGRRLDANRALPGRVLFHCRSNRLLALEEAPRADVLLVPLRRRLVLLRERQADARRGSDDVPPAHERNGRSL